MLSKIVIRNVRVLKAFDTPNALLNIHDTLRRRETVNAIKDLCNRCLQVIVLSHDEFLLREVERRCVGVSYVAFKIDYSDGDEWSFVSAVNLEQLYRAEHVRFVDEVGQFVESGRRPKSRCPQRASDARNS